jgi:hypothetical protein
MLLRLYQWGTVDYEKSGGEKKGEKSKELLIRFDQWIEVH